MQSKIIRLKPFRSRDNTYIDLSSQKGIYPFVPDPNQYIYNFKLAPQNANYNSELTINIILKHTTNYQFNFTILLKRNQKLNIKIIVLPEINNFYFDTKIKAVIKDHAHLIIQTDTIPQNNVTIGYANFQKRFIVYDNAQVESIPEFTILPADIEQIHGMVIYSPDKKEQYFLGSRGFSGEKVKELLEIG